MYILPYILEQPKVSTSEFTLHTLWLFLTKGGQALWKTDSHDTNTGIPYILKEYLEGNGLYGSITCVKEDVLYFCVDTKRTNRTDFYNWLDENVDESMEVWRPFFWIEDTNQSSTPWGWQSCAETHLLHIDSGITKTSQKMIQKLSLKDIWQTIKK